MDKVRIEIQRVVRDHYGWVLARIVRTVRDLDQAEDAVQLALEAALKQWPKDGIPDAPRAWLMRAARNRAIDELRKRGVRERKAEEVGWLEELNNQTVAAPDDDPEIKDDMMRLIFTCCHPALAREAQVALTLKVVAGLTTEEIARAFLLPVQTMAQRIVRAKRKIRQAKLPYRIPAPADLADRGDEARAVIYLVFNEGYTATSGAAWFRTDLCRHAIRLGTELANLLDDSQSVGLLALMLLHDARRAARVDATGDMILLADQDRALWDGENILRGSILAKEALTKRPVGTYAIQAGIAALHGEAKAHVDTDWPQIVGLYDALYRLEPTPIVALNRAVAVAAVDGPARALDLVDKLAEQLSDYHLFHATRGDFLRRMKQYDEALASYKRALDHCHNAAEKRFLRARVTSCDDRLLAAPPD